MINTMKHDYDWQSHLSTTVYASFPEVHHKPIIGITGNYGEQTCKIAEGYYKCNFNEHILYIIEKTYVIN